MRHFFHLNIGSRFPSSFLQEARHLWVSTAASADGSLVSRRLPWLIALIPRMDAMTDRANGNTLDTTEENTNIGAAEVD